MASHFLEPLITGGFVPSKNVFGTQYSKSELESVRSKFPEISLSLNNAEAVRDADIIMIGVKPPDFVTIANEIRGHLKKDSVVISIMAGIPLERLSTQLNHDRVVRCMPNTPVKIREGVLPYCTTDSVSEQQKETCDYMFSTLGTSIYLNKESHLDISTAISGSSPAYFFLIMEALTDAGVHCGLPRRQAELMAMKSMQGSVNMALGAAQKTSLPELKSAVTSPGGTTASALYQAEKHGLRHTIAEIVWACYRRSLEIAHNDEKVYGPDSWKPR